jgi:hypothetical protein
MEERKYHVIYNKIFGKYLTKKPTSQHPYLIRMSFNNIKVAEKWLNDCCEWNGWRKDNFEIKELARAEFLSLTKEDLEGA